MTNTKDQLAKIIDEEIFGSGIGSIPSSGSIATAKRIFEEVIQPESATALARIEELEGVLIAGIAYYKSCGYDPCHEFYRDMRQTLAKTNKGSE